MFRLVAALLMLLCVTGTRSLVITDTGLKPWKLEDTALVAYVTVINHRTKPAVDVQVDLKSCCLDEVDNVDHICQTFKVLGDSTPSIKPGDEKTFTILLPTVYPYDRHVDCTIDVNFNKNHHVQHPLDFDTRLYGDSRQLLPVIVRNQTDRMLHCMHPDLDPVRGCKPVKCIAKYGINKAYYDPRTKKCEKTPHCPNLPGHVTKMLSITSTACRAHDMKLQGRKIVGMETFKSLEKPFSLSKKYKWLCVHGRRTRDGCSCHDGWTTSTNGHSAFDTKIKLFKACNTQTPEYLDIITPIWIVAAIIGTMVLSFLLGLLLLVTCISIHTRKKNVSKISRTSLVDEIDKKQDIDLSDALALVMTDYDATKDGELHLRKDDVIIELARTDDAQVWKGSLNGREGTFRVQFVEFYIATDKLGK